MSKSTDLIDRIQKYDGVEKFLILNKNGNKINSEIKDEEKGKNAPNNFTTNYSDIPKLVEKANSVARDINPLNELSFLQISYSNYEYLISLDEDLYVFTAIRTSNGRDKKETTNPQNHQDNDQKPNIIIIGAGASGLACGYKLKEKGFANITILEASEKLGGRLRVLPKEKKFADFDIELGGEEIHGKNTDYFNFVVNNGGKLLHFWEENKFYANYKNQFGTVDELIQKPENSDFKMVTELFEDIAFKFPEEYPDMTLRQYLVSKNISEEVFFFANARIGVEAGTDLDEISVKGFNDTCKSNRAGSCNYLLRNMSHVEVIRKAFGSVTDKIKFNTEITRIDYSEDEVKIYDRKGIKYECDKCVITVPVTQLKKFEFTPHLPEKISSAIKTAKMDNCAKIILKFKQCVWPTDSTYILIPGLVNVFWATSQGKNTACNVITGMTAGENCRILNKLYKTNKEEFIDRIISELEKGLNVQNLKSLLLDFFWFDWSDVPFIEGGYSYICVNEGDSRSAFRETVDDKLYFAGEASAEWGHISTIHGAIESGFRVASQISLKLNCSN